MSKFELIEECAAQKTAVVILSAGGRAAPVMADLLKRLGCDAPASERNGTSKITEFNNAILESSGTLANHWTPFNTRWLASPKATEFLRKALEILQTEFDGSYLSVIQDTYTPRLLPFWNVVFDRAGVVPRYLFVISDPSEFAKDLYERFEIEQRIGHLIWLRAALDAEANSRGRLRAFAHAAQLSQPAATLNSLAKTLKLTFPRDVQTTFASKDFRLKEFRKLVRRSESAPSGARASATADWVTNTHYTLTDWASNGEKREAGTSLDSIRNAFDEAVPIFLGVGESPAPKSAKLRELEQKLEALQSKLRRTEEASRLTEEEANLNVSKAETRARLAEQATKEIEIYLKGRISHLESALAQRMAEVDETWQSLDDARREISAVKQELESARDAARIEVTELREANADGKQALDNAQEELRARYGEIVTLTRMLASETSAARKFERSARRLGAIAHTFERGATRGRIARWPDWILPWRWHLRRIKRSIEREGLFDSGAYLGANPDVESAGVDPLRHYLCHGASEDRPLGIE